MFWIKDFGPLTVAMDSHGRNLYEDVKEVARQKLPDIYEKLGITEYLCLLVSTRELTA